MLTAQEYQPNTSQTQMQHSPSSSATRAPPSNCASRRAAKMLAAISKTRFLPSSMVFDIPRLAGELMQDLRELILAVSLLIRHWRS